MKIRALVFQYVMLTALVALAVWIYVHAGTR